MPDKIQWSGKTTSYHHKWHDTPNPPGEAKSGFRKIWFLDAQWSDCPVEVEEEVRKIWQCLQLGNDHYIFKTCINDLSMPSAQEYTHGECPAIVQWVREKVPEIKGDEIFIIHWWW